ncbi:40S ribosomal protein S20, partial [Fragariocoptes setiger]
MEKKPEAAPTHKIRLTLSSTNVKALENVCAVFLDRAGKRSVKGYGPVRMPTKTLRITTRKTPCGEGSKTWSRYQMRIHKRVLDLVTSSDTVKDITRVAIDPVVDVQIIMKAGN